MKITSSLLLVIIPIFLFGQTNISVNELTGVLTKKNSPFYIYNDILVPEDQSLIIEPGVIIEFKGRYQLFVYGILKAEGTKTDSIHFRASNLQEGWKGISFLDNANQNFENDSSVLSFTVISNIISDNAVRENIYLSEYSKLRISNNLITNNYCTYGIIRCSSNSSPLISYNTISLNQGPAIYCVGSNPKIVNNYIISNGHLIPPQSGSGIMLENSSPYIINNIIADNHSDGLGSAICCFYNSNPLIVNNTICFNKSIGEYGSTGGICFDEYSSSIITNCILWGNTSTLDNYQLLYFSKNIYPKTKFSVLEGGKDAISSFPYGNEEVVINEIYSDCYEEDPGFKESENWNFELLPSSICVNTGILDTTGLNIPLTDILGNNRFFNDRIDIGAIEYQESPGNKKPVLSKIERLDMIKNSIVQMKIQFEDLDTNDSHTFQIKSNIDQIKIQNIVTDTKYPTYEITPSYDWIGNTIITVIINDNSGALNSMDTLIYPLNVSPFACGKITGNTTWNQKIIEVSCDVTISENSTLTINEGTIIEFQNYSVLNVEGRILALGSRNKPITFTAKNISGYPDNMAVGWQGINFYNNAKDTSVMRFCKIFYTSTPDYDVNAVLNGAALYLDKYKSLDIQNCLFEQNKAYGDGGAIYANQSAVKISNSKFQKNYAMHGGVGAFYSCKLELQNDTLAFNSNSVEGSALYIRNCEATIKNCFISNNQSNHDNFKASIDVYEGIMKVYNSIICNNSGGIAVDGSDIEILNSLIYNNSNFSIDTWNCIPKVANCIISGDFINSWGAPEISYSILDNPYFKDKNNFVVMPGFIKPTTGNGIQFNGLSADWGLKNNSYAINLGKPDTDTTKFSDDIAGNHRISDNRIDIGAYEFQGSPANRKPVIIGMEDIDVVPESITQLTISYWDPDTNDKHKIEISSSQPNVLIENILQDSAKFTFSLKCINNWEGVSVINIKVNDNSGSENAEASESFNLISKNEVCGQIKYNTTWMADTVFIVCNTEIADNVNLTIKAGTNVLFAKNTGLEIVGNVIAIGNEQDSIHFSSINEDVTWNGISIKNGFYAYYHDPNIMNDNDTTILSFCNIYNISSDGIFIDNFSKLIIKNSHLFNINGTALYLYESSPVIKNNLIENCTSKYRECSTIYAERSSNPLIMNNIIRFNKSISGGGINCYYGSNAIITGNLIYENEANAGGGIYCDNSYPKIYNNTIVKNKAVVGGGIYGRYSSPEIFNSIIWSNEAGEAGNQMNFLDDSPKIKHCLISNNENDMIFSIQPSIYEIVLSDDPLFDSNSDYFELSENSLCINTGTDISSSEYLPNDILGNNRIFEKLDIGATEFQGTPAPLPPVDVTLSTNYIYENNLLKTFIGKFTTLDPNIEDIFVYNLLEGDGTNDKNNSEFVIINDSLFSNSIFDYEDENLKSIYVVVFDQTYNSLNKTFQINIGNNFEAPVLINPIADIKTNIDSLFTFTIPENSFWFEFNFARSYQAFLKGSDQLPEWLSFDQLTGTFLGTPGYSGSFEIVVLAKNWGITSLPDTFFIDVLPYTSNTKENIFNNELNIYPNPASNQIMILTSFPIDFVAISDISGRWIYQDKLNGLTSTKIQVEKFPRGIYTIIVKNDKQIFTRKIILQ